MLGLWITFLALVSSAVLVPAKSHCRCLYGESCWPDDAEFSKLGTQLSRPLLHPLPIAYPCYPNIDQTGNCTDVQTHARDGIWRSGQPSAAQFWNYEAYFGKNGTIEACYLNTTLGYHCEQGSVSNVGVDARNGDDVGAAIKFAEQHNLRVVVKNTGHDYLGRSSARGSMLIWTHNMKNITYDPNFVPTGSNSSTSFKAMTLGAGVQWAEAYAAANEQGRFIVGGISVGGSVGAAGGWVMGGGHSAFSPRHGLGVDNVLQFTVVTATGEQLTVNSYQHSDLFWALRGGGGGTYAIVTSATYQTHDSVPIVLVGVNATFTTPAAAQNVTAAWIKSLPGLADKQWGGYSTVSSEIFSVFYVAPNVSVTDANATMDPFVTYAKSVTPNVEYFAYLFPSFYPLFTTLFTNGSQVGDASEIGSRLIPRDMMENQPSKVAEAMISIGGAGLNFVAGGEVSRVDPESTGLNPAWRQSTGLVVFGESWEEGALFAEIIAARNRIRKNVEIMDKVAGPASATYFNEATLYEKDPKKTFFGSHYPRLKAIKKKYDPQGLFIVAEGVGSEDWDASLNCRI